jgi:hypothetical protein
MTTTEIVGRTNHIAALHGVRGASVQAVLADFALRRRREGMRIAGVVEEIGCPTPGMCKNLGVRDLASGETISISQKLGPGSTACNLDPSGLARACALVENAIEGGADLVILSKFGKAEAARGGFFDAFRAAICAGAPIVTYVPAVLAEEWERFASGLFESVLAEDEALESWWRASGASRCGTRQDESVFALH